MKSISYSNYYYFTVNSPVFLLFALVNLLSSKLATCLLPRFNVQCSSHTEVRATDRLYFYISLGARTRHTQSHNSEFSATNDAATVDDARGIG